MNKKKKTILLSVLGILLIIAIIIGSTYAFWKVTKVQEGEANTLTTTCLDVDLTSMSSGINLQTQFPITDEEGRKTEGYTFKISNKCNTYVSYDINLESLNNVAEANRLNLNNLVAIIDDGNVLQLGYYPTTTTALKTEDGTAYDTRKLVTDTLSPGSTSTPTSKEYTLRVWLDEDASIEAANKEWNGKISVTASPIIAENAVAKLTELAKTNTEEMFTDDTADANIRYMGADPANYVTFSNESYSEDLYYGYYSTENHNWQVKYSSLSACQKGIANNKGVYEYNVDCEKIHSKGDPILWRIIGAMNNVEDGTGLKETRLKIVSETGFGNNYIAWDAKCTKYNSETGMCINITYSNNWETASLNKTLNDAFYNSKKTTDLQYYWNYQLSGHNWKYIDFQNSGLKSKNHYLIGDAKYYLGSAGLNNDDYYYGDYESLNLEIPVKLKDYYLIERSNIVYADNPTTWTGKVGLMYPSDYIYATGGGSIKDRMSCITVKIEEDWEYYAGNTECGENNWLTSFDTEELITPALDSEGILTLDGPEILYGLNASDTLFIRPVVYLKSDAKIMGGDGTRENPYKLAA